MDLRGGGLAMFFGGSLLSISLVTVNVFENKIKRAIGLVSERIWNKACVKQDVVGLSSTCFTFYR